MTLRATGLTCLALAFGCSSNEGRLDGYRKEINHAAALEDQAHEEIARRVLEGSMWNWVKQPEYSEIRAGKRDLRATNEVRLEIGNQYSGSYKVIWIFETAEEAVTLSKLGRSSGIVKGRVSKSAWNELLKKSEALSRDFSSCKSRLGVNDGDAFFGTYSSRGVTRRFAVYGLDFFPIENEEQRKYSNAMAPCKEFVSLVFSVVGFEPRPHVAVPIQQ